MKNNRREFFKLGGLAGAGFLGSNVIPGFALAQSEDNGKSRLDHIRKQAMRKHNQRFNMCGYAAPKMDKVRIGFIGLGNRGPVHSNQTSRLEGVEIIAMCDLRQEKAEAAKKQVLPFGHNPAIYAGKEEEWKKLCNRDDIDLIYISTPWH